ncbi:MAG: hypothetical protein ACI87W_002382 [Halieaceae bacterium]|jgi:hypothetical protein
MSTYKPSWESKLYHKLSRSERKDVASEVNRRFREQTGVSRSLDPNSRMDRELRKTWLRIRDSVVHDREVAEDMILQRQDVMDDLPGIVAEDMKTQGWKVGAELMETWFERPPAVMPHYSSPVTKVIKMDWVLSFSQAKAVFDEIIRKKIWTNLESKQRIAKIQKKNPVIHGNRFGNLSMSVIDVDKNSVNSMPVRSRSWPLMAALGSFELTVAVSGVINGALGKNGGLKIDEIGVYVEDSYDFNGAQFLGLWGHRDTPVNNIDFREWRAKNRAGGDFRVFSDVKRIRLSTPDIIEFI